MKLAQNYIIYRTASDLNQICKPLKQLSINHFAFTRSFPNGERIYLSTTPKWQEIYFENDFQRAGVCEHKPKTYSNQVLLWSTLPQQHIYQEYKSIGLREGLFLVKKHHKYTDFFDFVTDSEGPIVNTFISHFEYLNRFADNFTEQAENILAQRDKNTIILPHKNGHAEFAQFEREFSSKKLPKPLSRQQHKCAKRLLQGYSYKQIAKELSLSPRTVETYINNLKIKYRVNSRAELIAYLSQRK